MLNWFNLAGCFFIAYLSIRALKDSFNSSAVPEPHTTPLRKNHRSGLMTGFIVGISNPKDIIFFVFFPQFINVTTSLQGSIAMLSIARIIIDLSIWMAYIFLMRQQFVHKYR